MEESNASTIEQLLSIIDMLDTELLNRKTTIEQLQTKCDEFETLSNSLTKQVYEQNMAIEQAIAIKVNPHEVQKLRADALRQTLENASLRRELNEMIRKEQTSDFVEPITIKEEPDTRLIEFEEYKAGIVAEMTKTREAFQHELEYTQERCDEAIHQKNEQIQRKIYEIEEMNTAIDLHQQKSKVDADRLKRLEKLVSEMTMQLVIQKEESEFCCSSKIELKQQKLKSSIVQRELTIEKTRFDELELAYEAVVKQNYALNHSLALMKDEMETLRMETLRMEAT